MPREFAWLLAPPLLGWVLALCVPRVRQAFLNGWRCLARHAALWKIPVWFTLAYVGFQIIDLLILTARTEEKLLWETWTAPTALSTPVLHGLISTTESLATVFNCLVATYPISAVAGLLFLCNYRRLSGEMSRALVKIFGWRGRIIFLVLLTCAFCALVKPLFLLALPELTERLPFGELMLGASIANTLSFVFEYILGTCLQIYLLIVAYGWVRGSEFDSEKLLRFAVRRLGFVFKWALVIISATIVFLHLPMLAGFLFTGVPAPLANESIVRLGISLLMLALAGMPIRLVLHNETLAVAIRSYLRLIRRHGWAFALFLLTAFTTLLPVKFLEIVAAHALGESLLSQLTTAATQLICAFLGGWILASWVCFYKSCSTRTPEIAF